MRRRSRPLSGGDLTVVEDGVEDVHDRVQTTNTIRNILSGVPAQPVDRSRPTDVIDESKVQHLPIDY